MYVNNINSFPENKIYRCSGIIANWLIREKNIPLLGKSKNGEFCFSKTDLLEEVLEQIPFYFKIAEKLF